MHWLTTLAEALGTFELLIRYTRYALEWVINSFFEGKLSNFLALHGFPRQKDAALTLIRVECIGA